ncbi:hypothetical protein K491DRAFT_722772 [Lophiostoma macrostomum CBS 122681]|uniref:Geranylgeranyl pyrophosphate synthetase n=1 Tax=Lophiostoma macrostomum CBS 122681 TaxID=1314788 RepID=A0A6A6SMI5_9PLEO|nr:hypothetical protein K491DRAFT_722772 [Lophiostoma macrostomum CBS 122681]
MTNELIAEICRQDLEGLNIPTSASITDVQHLASYNWVEAPKATPTVAVPGSPNRWSPPNAPFRVRKDIGRQYIAQNAARHPDSPLEPLFRSLYIVHPSFNITSIDVVTDRNNIRKLLGLVNPRLSTKGKEDFTIHVEIVNNTVIFCRKETKTIEYIGPNAHPQYGHSFEKKCTSRQIKQSTGHHRMISYSLGGLNFLIRHETDGYVGTTGTELSLQAATADNRVPGAEDISNVLNSLSLSSGTSEVGNARLVDSKLVIRKEGQQVPLSSTIEVKTRVSHKKLRFSDVVVQLWVSQTPKLVRAYHTNGLFDVPEVEDVTAQVKTWEDQNQKDLKTLIGLIRKIRDVVKECGGRAILKYDAKGDKVVFHKLGGLKMLPNDLYAKWEASHDQV